jgi:hypothetical protein
MGGEGYKPPLPNISSGFFASGKTSEAA